MVWSAVGLEKKGETDGLKSGRDTFEEKQKGTHTRWGKTPPQKNKTKKNFFWAKEGSGEGERRSAKEL